MLIRMRTTVIIDDEVLRGAKARAVERNTSLSRVIEDALRHELRAAPDAPASPFVMVVFGPEGETRELSPAEVWRAVEADDASVVGG